MKSVAFTAALVLLPIYAAAQTHFGVKAINVDGNYTVFATAINDKDQIVGTSSSFTSATGFVLSGGNVTTLPSPCQELGEKCVPFPTSINGHGTVAGYYVASNDGNSYGFTWQPGQVGLGASFQMYAGECIPCFSPILSAKGDVAFSTAGTEGLAPGTYQGTPGALHLVNGVSSQASIQSLNKRDVLVGTDRVLRKGRTVTVAFAASGGAVRHIRPYGTTNVYSAVINDYGLIAGSLLDKSGVWHGFLQARGSVSLFEMPTEATYISVRGINNLGRVVGVYTDTNKITRPFLYNGTVTSNIDNITLGNAGSDVMAINDHGVIILSTYQSYQSLNAYRILCGGPGC